MGRYIYSGKRQHICLTNCVTERNKYPSTCFGWGNKGDVQLVLLYDRQKISTAIVHFIFFSLAGLRDKQFVFAIRQNSV